MPIITLGMEALRSLVEVLESPDIELIGGNVCFGFDDSKAAVQNFSAKFSPGELVAFGGESGSGKSSLMNLLIGFWRPVQGRILLDGADNGEIDLRSWRPWRVSFPD